MLKKTFIRLMLLGTIALASFFVFISANKAHEPVNSDCTESSTKKENLHTQGEYIWESLAATILAGTK